MVSAIVLAGGSGSRMKSDKAKQFIEVDGKPLIYYALRTFEASVVDEIILSRHRRTAGEVVSVDER